jgi:hypothetical protein
MFSKYKRVFMNGTDLICDTRVSCNFDSHYRGNYVITDCPWG